MSSRDIRTYGKQWLNVSAYSHGTIQPRHYEDTSNIDRIAKKAYCSPTAAVLNVVFHSAAFTAEDARVYK
jgi:hypothetical protein